MKRKSKKILGIILMLFISINLHANVIKEIKVRKELYPQNFEKEFQENLNFFIDGVGVDPKAHIPYDTITINDGKVEPAMYTNTSEIGLYLNLLVEMEKAGDKKALVRISQVLGTLEAAPKWEGLFYWPYDIKDGKLVKPENEIIPSVDNGNLAFSLASVAGAYIDSKDKDKKEIVARIDKLLGAQANGWVKLYDKNKKLLSAGWDSKANKSLGYFIDRKTNESRIAALWAVLSTSDLKNKVPNKAFTNMELHRKKYTIKDKEYNPMLTWDGSFFQAMLPGIWIDEKALISDYSMVEDNFKIQVYYAVNNGIPALVSASTTVQNEYLAYGVPYISEKAVLFKEPIHEGGTGTPHATALAYMIDKKQTVDFLKRLRTKYPEINSTYGWYDAIDNNGKMSHKVLSLDQGMFIGAFLSDNIHKDVNNYLEHKGYSELIKKLYKSFK